MALAPGTPGVPYHKNDAQRTAGLSSSASRARTRRATVVFHAQLARGGVTRCVRATSGSSAGCPNPAWRLLCIFAQGMCICFVDCGFSHIYTRTGGRRGRIRARPRKTTGDRFMKSRARGFAAGLLPGRHVGGSGDGGGQAAGEDRHPDRYVGHLCRHGRAWFGRGGATGDRRLPGRRMQGHENRPGFGRQPEQDRRRGRQGARVVRPRWRHRHRRSDQLRRGAGGAGHCAREEQGRDVLRSGRHGADQPGLLAAGLSLDVRHVFAIGRRGQGHGAGGRQVLVLHHRRLRLRPFAGGRYRQGRPGPGGTVAGSVRHP